MTVKSVSGAQKSTRRETQLGPSGRKQRLERWRWLFDHFTICMHTKSLWFCSILCDSGLQPASLLCPWDSPGKNPGVGCHAFLQGIFPTQGSSPCLVSDVSYIGRQALYLEQSGKPISPYICNIKTKAKIRVSY